MNPHYATRAAVLVLLLLLAILAGCGDSYVLAHQYEAAQEVCAQNKGLTAVRIDMIDTEKVRLDGLCSNGVRFSMWVKR